jgi:putative ubiquitin-RnfH superfamily antitoxin RatB of RatAB toxin-antitoxin module
MAPDPEPTVEVAYARPDRQRVIALPLRPGLTVLGAIEASGILELFPEIGSRPLEVGIFGQRVEVARVLQAGDRVEIYRPLPDDPKERRRRRAAETGGAGRRRSR